MFRRLYQVAAAALLLPALLSGALAAPPVCSGRDMLAEMQAEDPAAYARVMAAARATSDARNVLWRIERDGVPPSYLFGTMHLTDDRVNALSDNMRAALNSVRQIAVEVADVSPPSVAAAMGKLGELVTFRDGSTLETRLSKEQFEIARSALVAAGIPAQAAPLLRPWVVTMSLALTACERLRAASGLAPLDMRIGEHGKQRGIAVVGLETLEGQLHALATVPEQDQLELLKVTLKYYDRTDDLLETMIRRYLARDIGAIWPFQLELARKGGYAPEAFKSFEHQVVAVRNASMRDAALPMLKDGGVFIAVGALHLPGKIGLVALLREAGFSLVPVE
ncbi:MAG TPA: TraB/GumN family protein [Hyphomicrobiaceae bacterium]|nr:TraB/GumN family protein [Hyphomicrobiaceae bacterium]